MIIARRIHEISGVLHLDLARSGNRKQFLEELKTPSLALQGIALVGLIAAYVGAPPLGRELVLELAICVSGILLGVLITYFSRDIIMLNVGGFTTVLVTCLGFRLILVAAERTASWTLPLAALIALAIAMIVSGPAMYLLLMAVVWVALSVDFGVTGAPQHDGLWPQLLISTSILIGLILSAVLSRLRRLNVLCTSRLIDMAYKDHLTGLPNRRWFVEAVNLALKDKQLQGYLLILDIDNFKRINDEAGHDVGDAVLARVGAIIGAVAAGLPHGRIGGEEFSIVVPGQRQASAALSERLLQAVRAEPIAGRRVSVSIGASLLQGESISSSMRAADDALYCAKDGGKDRVVFHSQNIVDNV